MIPRAQRLRCVKRPAWAIVPAKSLARGKSRLRPVLADGERARFARGLLEHVLDVLLACELDGVLVATDGDDVAELAHARGAVVRRDRGEGSLAEVIDGSLAEVAARGALAAIVVMADLPHLVPDDVHGLVAALEDHDVVLVRDHLGRHTNALALAPPRAIATCFGQPESFAAHCAAVRDAGLRLTIVDNERLAFDVDAPADHAQLTETPPGAGT
jgi:2-phospho-L-lactate/phosphoenolpyruvate guanylyltransferase